jgi:putative ABC transport system ATP-binding protein
VSLARTLANAPVALLLDEPTSALDETSSRAIEELLLSIVHEQQIICAIVTHDTSQAHRIADRAMIIEKGKLVSIGPTKEVLDAH